MIFKKGQQIPGKNFENLGKSWNFVGQPQWEPCNQPPHAFNNPPPQHQILWSISAPSLLGFCEVGE